MAPLCRDPNTIFRGNSLTSKCIDETMKLAGMHYLQVTLKPVIDEENLRQYVERFFNVITKS
uniref:Ras-GAP domain-containing protein n=1 Tax=Callorhinchus milii TaxID=7868 RepID=A0A4W3IQ56_CALMI